MTTHDDRFEFDFFGDGETAETVERGRPFTQLASRRTDRGGAAGIRRLAGLVAVVIAAVVAFATEVAACQGTGGGYRGYLSEVRALGHESNQVGTQLARDLQSPPATHAALQARLQALAVREQQGYDRAQLIRPPGPLRQAYEELLAALELRATGLAELSQTLAGGSAKRPDASAPDALAKQAQLLTTSDVVWAQLYRTRTAQQLRAHHLGSLAVPQSRLVANPDLVSAAAFSRLLQRLQLVSGSGSEPLLKPGSSGPAVAAWQRQLNRWLKTQPGRRLLPVTGTFGPLTDAATTALQRAAGITVDGLVGAATRQALARALAAGG